jgi:superfamily II DNA or RNA helicase
MMELRPYQEEARQAIEAQWQDGVKRTLLVLPTGTGKTIVFAKIIENRVRSGERVLVLAHRGELLDQAADKLAKATGLGCATEKAEESCIGSWFRVVVGSVQSLMRPKRLEQFPPDYFDTIVVDEAHHVLADSYQRVLQAFSDSKVLGVTATPDRSDMRNLGAFFESLAYEYTLPRAIKEGFLSPIKALTIPLRMDLTGVGVQSGDFKAADLGTALDPYLHQIADEMVKNCRGRKTVVFLPLIKTSQKMRDILASKGFRAAEVNGDSDDRAEILEAFDRGDYDVLCNAMLLTEGWDCPSVDCIVVLRPTKIRSLYCQMVGRGTRLFPGKEDLLLLDFLWHTEKHELCRRRT